MTKNIIITLSLLANFFMAWTTMVYVNSCNFSQHALFISQMDLHRVERDLDYTIQELQQIKKELEDQKKL